MLFAGWSLAEICYNIEYVEPMAGPCPENEWTEHLCMKFWKKSEKFGQIQVVVVQKFQVLG